METKITSKNIKLFVCEKCDFKCSKKGDYSRHISTAKHKKKCLDTEFTSFTSNQNVCNCGKEYKNRAGLWKHKKKCSFEYESAESTITENTSEPIVEFLLKENHEMKKENLEIKKDNLEMKKMMIDLCQKIEPVSNNTNINSHNKIFNINLFLNEDCKHAMNMTEFIESIQLSIEDVEKIGMEGQTQALSNILSSKLNEIDIFKRPVHCSDAKKEIIYVKDEDKWEQEEKGKPKLKKALDKIGKESLCKVPEMTSDADNYVKTISEILKDPREDKKILSEVSKVLLVN